MKKTILFTILLPLLLLVCHSKTTDFNLDFETVKDNHPVHWKAFGSKDYVISIDSTIAKSVQ